MRILVTGANGHIGSNLVPALLARGHQVRASVRDPGDPAKAGPLQALGVEVVGLDVRRQDAFDRAAEGVELMYHLAATYSYVGKPAAEIIADSVEGAEAAIRAAARAGVRKVVMTSSVVTLPLIRRGEPKVDERQWQTTSRAPYMRAKTEAERRAWALAEELGVTLVTVLPGAVCGPGFARRTPSTDVIEGIMLGTMRLGTPDSNFPYVDVRDIVSGQILAGERDVAGRFILVNDAQPSFRDLVAAMRRADPEVPKAGPRVPAAFSWTIPLVDRLTALIAGSPRVMSPELNETVGGRLWAPSNRRAKTDLGWRPAVSLDDSLADTIRALRALRRVEGKKRMA